MAPRRSQDSVSNAGRISSFLRQAAANKAASDARKQFREKRHRAELEKLKAGQALETVKDEEEDAANDAIMKLALEFEQGIREETWSVHPLEWMNERHVARCGAEGKDWYMEKWLKECKAGNEYNDDDDDDDDDDNYDDDDNDDKEDDDEDDEWSEDTNEEDDSDDNSDGEDNDSDKDDSKEKGGPKGMKQKLMTNLKIEQKKKTAKIQKPMGNGKIEQKLQTAKRQRPKQKGKIK